MATYAGRETGIKRMSIGGVIGRFAIGSAVVWAALTAGQLAWDKMRNGNAPTEKGFVDYKSLERVEKKNSSGNMETYLEFKHDDEIDYLPCMEGYSGGAVCGGIDYIVENLTPRQKEDVVVGQFPDISNESKRGLVKGELDRMLESAYGVQGSQPQQPAIPPAAETKKR
ncbi:TPA: hypothetical protein HA231_04615 [Candidatus Woesearchaeota archaeon]|nr:hypothetical protein [Candidatus Woesearchaeota archaeon]